MINKVYNFFFQLILISDYNIDMEICNMGYGGKNPKWILNARGYI